MMRNPGTSVENSKDNAWVWNNYWHANRVASCLTQGTGNYSGSIKTFWEQTFQHLPKNTSILDLCTGNGAVLMIADAVNNHQAMNFQLTGIDQSDIQPQKFVTEYHDRLSTCCFVAGQSVEALPFPDQHFDYLTSQYGIEYSELSRTLKEIERVLRPQGGFTFVMHAAEGAVVADAREEIAACHVILEKVPLFTLCEKAIRADHAIKPDVTGSDAATAFRNALDGLRMEQEKSLKPIIVHMVDVLIHTYNARQHFSLDILIAKIHEAHREVVAHQVRNQQLIDAALKRQALEALSASLASQFLDRLVIDALYQDSAKQVMVAWTLATRNN